VKYNLKNFPFINDAYVISKIGPIIEWLEGFEKELREILKNHISGQYWSADILIKEILGDVES